MVSEHVSPRGSSVRNIRQPQRLQQPPGKASSYALSSRYSPGFLLFAKNRLANIEQEKQDRRGKPARMPSIKHESLIFSPRGKLMTGAEVMARFGATSWLREQGVPHPLHPLPPDGDSALVEDDRQPPQLSQASAQDSFQIEYPPIASHRTDFMGAEGNDKHSLKTTRDDGDDDAATHIQRISRGRIARSRSQARKNHRQTPMAAPLAEQVTQVQVLPRRGAIGEAASGVAAGCALLTAEARKSRELNALASNLGLPLDVQDAALRFGERHEDLAYVAARRLNQHTMQANDQLSFRKAVQNLTRNRIFVPDLSPRRRE